MVIRLINFKADIVMEPVCQSCKLGVTGYCAQCGKNYEGTAICGTNFGGGHYCSEVCLEKAKKELKGLLQRFVK